VRDLLKEAKEIINTLVEDRRYLHENAEVETELPLTTAYVKNKLKNIGCEPQEICRSGISAVIGGKRPGKTFLLRADMDALPIREETGLPFASKTSNMHACGHDLHTSMLLGAAQLLKRHEDDIHGQVKLMFQPAEEIVSGAKIMIEAGVLENPNVDAAMMIHVFTGLPFPSGMIAIPPAGTISAASDSFTVNVRGKGGHGAMPQMSIDPLNVISHIHIALQAVNARELSPNDITALTVGQIHGGNAANVIPDAAFLSGTIRTYSKENRQFIKERVKEISLGIASTFRAAADVEYFNGCPSVINSAELVRQITEYSINLLGKEQVADLADLAGGAYAKIPASEDFGFVSELVPSLMLILSAGSLQEGYQYPQHHPKALFNEDILYLGAALHANSAIEWLKNN
jgi:hippurate hydrolase